MIFDTSTATEGLNDGSKSVVSQEKLEEDLNRFLNLLVTQLQNQDPLDPMDTNEFTSQLVGFAGVEQQINANANLEKLLALQQTNQVGSMVSFIGTTVQASGDQFWLENDFAAFTYDLETNSRETTIAIQNAEGQTVFSSDGETGAGSHGFVWNGKTAGGLKLPDGVYTAVVRAQNDEGEPVNISQTVFGRVTGSGIDENGVVQLFMNEVEVDLDSVVSVNETPDGSTDSSDDSGTGDGSDDGTGDDEPDDGSDDGSDEESEGA